MITVHTAFLPSRLTRTLALRIAVTTYSMQCRSLQLDPTPCKQPIIVFCPFLFFIALSGATCQEHITYIMKANGRPLPATRSIKSVVNIKLNHLDCHIACLEPVAACRALSNNSRLLSTSVNINILTLFFHFCLNMNLLTSLCNKGLAFQTQIGLS